MYKKGRRFEYRVRDFLEDNGYFVIRSAGSKGIVDLAAFKFGEVLFVQSKGNSKPLCVEEWNDLYSKARQNGATPVHAYNDKGKIVLKRLMSLRTTYVKGLTSDFSPDSSLDQ